MDFSQLPLPKVAKASTDPFKIFGALPRLEGAPNDLWRGQADALAEWNENREESDLLLSLNTGAGKTLVGLIIAKSFCNEGLDNVLYVCPTIDLVRQTAEQAKSVGIDVTTRTQGDFDNDLFESGKTFCITTYAAAFNGLSALRRKHFPDAVIFDDAHVAEAMMRGAFTLSISRKSHESLFQAISGLYRPHFRDLNRETTYAEALEQMSPVPKSILVPPDISRSTATQLSALLKSAGVQTDSDLKYPYQHLKDHLDQCAIIFRAGKLDITPPFLPSLALDIFNNRVRRVYLSATLHNKADIVRAFGREPTKIIEPKNDAGNGERLIIFNRGINQGSFDANFAARLKQKHKVLAALPSYHAAQAWSELGQPPSPDRFSQDLDAFRKSSKGAFILISRVDGIDLPNETCRLMVIDGIPRSDSLLEKFQFEYLHMRNFAASRIANRLVQLFGRINRGRSDYGAFLISGRELNIWLNNDKYVSLLPDLLRNQILLGRTVQDGMKITNLDSVEKLLDTVLLSKPRDVNWLDYYSRFLEANEIEHKASERAQKAEQRNFAAAKAEAIYAKHMWQRSYPEARGALDEIVADTARADEKLAGWHNLWIGATLHHEGAVDEGRYYFAQARGQLGSNLYLDTGSIGITQASQPAPNQPIVEQSLQLVSLGRESYTKAFGRLQSQLEPLNGGTPNQMEEAFRELGAVLGFSSTRPDNEYNTGPDVMWVAHDNRLAIGLELKTDKLADSQYMKSEISQALDHDSWMSKNAGSESTIGVVLIGPDAGVSVQANPTDRLFSAKLEVAASIRDRFLGIIQDTFKLPVGSRREFLEKSFSEGWRFNDIAKQFCKKPLA